MAIDYKALRESLDKENKLKADYKDKKLEDRRDKRQGSRMDKMEYARMQLEYNKAKLEANTKIKTTQIQAKKEVRIASENKEVETTKANVEVNLEKARGNTEVKKNISKGAGDLLTSTGKAVETVGEYVGSGTKSVLESTGKAVETVGEGVKENTAEIAQIAAVAINPAAVESVSRVAHTQNTIKDKNKKEIGLPLPNEPASLPPPLVLEQLSSNEPASLPPPPEQLKSEENETNITKGQTELPAEDNFAGNQDSRQADKESVKTPPVPNEIIDKASKSPKQERVVTFAQDRKSDESPPVKKSIASGIMSELNKRTKTGGSSPLKPITNFKTSPDEDEEIIETVFRDTKIEQEEPSVNVQVKRLDSFKAAKETNNQESTLSSEKPKSPNSKSDSAIKPQSEGKHARLATQMKIFGEKKKEATPRQVSSTQEIIRKQKEINDALSKQTSDLHKIVSTTNELSKIANEPIGVNKTMN